MSRWSIVPGSVVLKDSFVINGGWYANIVNGKLYIDEEAHGSEANLNEDGTPRAGQLVFDFWPEDCEKLNQLFARVGDAGYNEIFEFAQALYEADRNQPGRTIPYYYNDEEERDEHRTI